VMADYCLLSCDDKKPPTIKNHEEYSTRIKNIVTEIYRAIERKGKDSIMVNPKCRLMIGVNNDAEGYRLLPPMHESVKGKVMIFNVKFPNMSLEKYENLNDPIEDSESVFAKELPFIRKYLLGYQPPGEITDDANSRFGIKPYHCPDINTESTVLSVSSPLHESLQSLNISGYSAITFTAGSLYEYLDMTRKLHSSGVSGVQHLPHLLKSITKYNPKLIVAHDDHLNQGRYTLTFAENPTLPTVEMRHVLETINQVRREHSGITINEIFNDYTLYES
jgi:hypothetical protein